MNLQSTYHHSLCHCANTGLPFRWLREKDLVGLYLQALQHLEPLLRTLHIASPCSTLHQGVECHNIWTSLCQGLTAKCPGAEQTDCLTSQQPSPTMCVDSKSNHGSQIKSERWQGHPWPQRGLPLGGFRLAGKEALHGLSIGSTPPGHLTATMLVIASTQGAVASMTIALSVNAAQSWEAGQWSCNQVTTKGNLVHGAQGDLYARPYLCDNQVTGEPHCHQDLIKHFEHQSNLPLEQKRNRLR